MVQDSGGRTGATGSRAHDLCSETSWQTCSLPRFALWHGAEGICHFQFVFLF